MTAVPAPRWPGVLAAVLGLLTAAGLISGIVLATSGLFELATWVAWATTGVSAAAVLLGLGALIGRLGRGWAAIGVLLGVIANPLLLVHGLGWIGRLGA